MAISHLRLGVNVDHVATIRNARGGRHPDPVARGQDRDRGRRRRHHRASARRSPPHPRRRHRAAQGGNLQAAQFRNGGDRRNGARSRCRPGRMPPAWCPSAARSAPPKAASMRPASATRSRRRWPDCGTPAFVSRCSSPPSRGRSRRRSSVGAPVIEIHTGAWCDALADDQMEAAEAEWLRIVEGREDCAAGWARSPCRARTELRDRGSDRRAAGGGRAQYRAFPDRRGDLFRARGRGEGDARRRWITAARKTKS